MVIEDLKEFLKLISKFSKNNHIEDVNPNQLVSIMFTSGSSGQPKGVMLSHKSVNQSIKNITSYVGYSNLNKEVIPLPLHHNFGLGHLYCTHFGGGAVYITDGMKSLKKFFNAFDEDYNATALSPSMLKILLNKNFFNKTLLIFNKLRYIIVNTEKLNKNIIENIIEKCPNLRFMFYYGLTEASRTCFITLSSVDKRYYSSVGKPISDNVSVKIIDGEICIAGDHLFSGYINDENYYVKDSYFKTGDLGYFNNDGYLFITGKKKDQLNIGGLKISSEEIKTAMLNLKEIEDVAVVSVKDKFTGETPAALVVKKTRLR